MNDYKHNIINYLERVRREKAWTVYRLAKESEIPESCLRRAISNKTDVNIITLLKWAHALNCSVIIESNEQNNSR